MIQNAGKITGGYSVARRQISQRTASQATDQFVPSEIQNPHPVPKFRPSQTLEQRAAQLESSWAERVPDPVSVVGVIVERGWDPTEEHNPVLNICDAIMDSGGIPKLIFQGRGDAEHQMGQVNALAIPGGRDIDPSKYGQERGPGMADSSPDPAFDDFEIEAIRWAYDSGMPMLGHCRGAQIMNVAGGGTMTQDIPTEFETAEGWGSKYGTPVNHRPEIVRPNDHLRVHPVHLIYVEPRSRLAEVVGDSLEAVNSVHHQCIANLSPLFDVVAWSLDGLVEGIQRKGMPWQAGYQFHAEAQRYTDPKYQVLYDHLVRDGADFRDGKLPL